MIDHKKNAAAGATLFDEKRPGWYRGINVAELDMIDDCKCIVGQSFPTYVLGLMELGLGIDEDKSYGFNLNPEEYNYDSNQEEYEFEMLREAWIGEINRRIEFEKMLESMMTNKVEKALAIA